jgi:hypothetical protein
VWDGFFGERHIRSLRFDRATRAGLPALDRALTPSGVVCLAEGVHNRKSTVDQGARVALPEDRLV